MIRLQATILSADVEGFALHMYRSEEATVRAIGRSQALFRAVMAQCGGTLVDVAGDSALAYFADAVDALKCATAIQRQIADSVKAGSDDVVLRYRIGLAEGQILKEGAQIFGRAVIEAARIQALVSAGNIGISHELYDRLRHHELARSAMPIGAQVKKNEPLQRAFEIRVKEGGSPDTAPLFVPIVALSPIATGAYDGLSRSACDIATPVILDRFGREGWDIRLLALEGGHDPGADARSWEYQIRGIIAPQNGSSVLILNLFYGRSLQFLASIYQPLSTLASVITECQVAANRMIAAIGRHQAEVVFSMKGVPRGAYQLYAGGRASLLKLSRDEMQAATRMLREALQIRPDYARAQAALAKAYSLLWRFDWPSGVKDPLEESIALARNAVLLSPADPMCQAGLGFTSMWAKEKGSALHAYARAVELGLCDPDEIADYAMILASQARSSEAIALVHSSLRDVPSNQDYRLWTLGDIHFSNKHYDLAFDVLGRMRNPAQANRLRAASAAKLGKDASAFVADVLVEQPDFSVGKWIDLQPLADSAESEDYADGLMAAGLPA